MLEGCLTIVENCPAALPGPPAPCLAAQPAAAAHRLQQAPHHSQGGDSRLGNGVPERSSHTQSALNAVVQHLMVIVTLGNMAARPGGSASS